MEETVSGFKVRGDWTDVVEHGERITRALHEAGVEGPAFEEWDEWRPKVEERIDEDVNEKTAEQASVSEGAGEQKGRSPNEDIARAGESLGEASESLEEDPERAVEKSKESVNYVTRAADSAGRKALRRVEDAVYRRVMTRIAPYYFDNELISANLERLRNGDEFAFEVNVTDDELKAEVSEHLDEYESVDRWHVDTTKDTTTAEAAEGVETPTNGDDAPSSTTT
jgi:hypothetical protein